MANFPGSAGDDTLNGTNQADTFTVGQGGADTVSGSGGDDVIEAGAGFDSLDQFDGASGYDELRLTGDYAAGIVLGSFTLRRVENVVFGAGFSYQLTTHSATVAAGATLRFDGYAMSAGRSLAIDGSAETNGRFEFLDGQGDDSFTGGAMDDVFAVVYGGDDVVHGGGGNDYVNAEASLATTDVIDGGAGIDSVSLNGDYGGGLTLSGTGFFNVEALSLVGNHTYSIVAQDGVVAAGQSLVVLGDALSGGGLVNFDGSAETDGSFTFRGGTANDWFMGGAQADLIEGVWGGHDFLAGSGGNDVFSLAGQLDADDQISGGSGNDVVLLNGDYAGGLVLGALTLYGIELLQLTDGYDYVLTTHDGTVAAGQQLNVSAVFGSTHRTVFDGSAESDGRFVFSGGAGDDAFTGGGGNDYAELSQGGNDTFVGGGGDDAVAFFGGYTPGDFIDGGAGSDSAFLATDLSAGIVLGGAQMQNVELLGLGSGFSYLITTANSLVAAGTLLSVNGGNLGANEGLTFNGAAETNGQFALTGGAGNDQLTGGSLADTFVLDNTGADQFSGGGGNDVFHVNAGFTAADRLAGGQHADRIELNQDLGAGLTLAADTVTGIETINLAGGRGYKITTHDGTVAGGALLTVNGTALGAGHVLDLNGSADTDGRFLLQGGAGNDRLRGGAVKDQLQGGAGDDKLYGNGDVDLLTGAQGSDDLYGGAGNDRFVYGSAADSLVASADWIQDWNAGDRIDLSALDADTTQGGEQAFAFIGAAAFTAAGQLRATVGANTIVTGDLDGDGSADFRIVLAGAQALGANGFVL